VLAEHAADDAALAVSPDSGSYARVLLEVAARMEGQNSRLIWNASAMTGQLVAKRIRRVMDSRTKPNEGRLGNLGRAMLLSSAALLIWISVAVDLQSVARAQAKPSTGNADATWFGYRSDGGRPDSTTADQAAQMEQQLAANPEDEATRSKLLRYYFNNNMDDRRVPLVLWLIEHHPESVLHGYYFAAVSPGGRAGGDTDTFEDLRRRWLGQVALHPDDVRVLGNAARAMLDSTPEAIDLLKRAQKLDPAHRTEPLARLYSFLLWLSTEKRSPPTGARDPRISAQIKSELQESNDAALVGAVARHFVEDATQKALVAAGDVWDFAALKTIATDLVTHAQTLEPQSRDWADLMEGVRGLPVASAQPPAAPQVRIGAGVAAGMLLESPAPIYPPLAKMARVQGVVKLQVRIGKDGHVAEITVVGGHPLLVPAAMDAVKHYVYKPVTMGGKAVEAMTTVDVPFGLDAE